MSDHPFPSEDDKIFAPPEDYWSTACVNWCHDEWGIYAEGYKSAADLLVSHVIDHGEKNDTFVYPILFLYRQYLELEIKDLLQKCRVLEGINEPIQMSHRIDILWPKCHELLSKICPGESETELQQISRLIEEFKTVDPTSTAFRYPEDREGRPSLPGMQHINLRNVQSVMNKIYNLLFGASSQVGMYLSFKAEMAQDTPDERP